MRDRFDSPVAVETFRYFRRVSYIPLGTGYWVFALLVTAFFLCAAAVAQTSPDNLKLEIVGLSSTEYGYEVKVKVTNTGTRSVLLMLSTVAKPKLQSLDIQQWDGKSWRSVGPCLDVYLDRTTTLKARESIEDIVPMGDTSHGWTNSVCPRIVKHLGGKVRPVVYCAYDSERQFRNRMKSNHSCKLVEGSSFALPSKDNER